MIHDRTELPISSVSERLSVSTRTAPNFLAFESFLWLSIVHKWLNEPMILQFRSAFGMDLQRVEPPIIHPQTQGGALFSTLNHHL